MARAVTVTDDGHMWYGSDYEFGSLAWQPRLYEWYFDNSWMASTKVLTPTADKDMYRGVGVAGTGRCLGGGERLWDRPSVRRGPGSQSRRALDGEPARREHEHAAGRHGRLHLGRRGQRTVSVRSYDADLDQDTAAGNGINHIFLDDTVVPRALYVAGQNEHLHLPRSVRLSCEES